MRYYITAKHSHGDGYWRAAKAKSLAGAKREAAKLYHNDWRDSTLMVSTGDNITEERVIISKRKLSDARWWTAPGY
jgi:hypothetical protein